MAFDSLNEMVDVIYSEELATDDTVEVFAEQAARLRALFHALGVPATVWSHIWTVHFPLAALSLAAVLHSEAYLL